MKIKDREMKVLIISPTHDFPTILSTHMANQLNDLLSKHPKIDVDHIDGIRAFPTNIENVLDKKKYPLIVYFGHGKQKGWYHPFFKYLADHRDADLFKDSIISTMACHTSAKFGHDCVEAGAKAYIGNSQVVYGSINLPEWNYATDFIRVWQNEIINLLRGFTVKSCVNAVRKRLRGLANFYFNNSKLLEGEENAYRCEHNADFHSYIGNGFAKLPRVIQNVEELNMSALRFN